MPHLTENYQRFFMDLAPNNTSEWFNENRKRYENDVKAPFASLVNDMIVHLGKIDKSLGGVKASDCIFRINRDIRFSKDKTPYKLNMSAHIAPGGRKDHSYPGFYFEATPEGVNIYGGVYEAEKPQLDAIRNHIASNLKKFESLLNADDFKAKYKGQLHGEKQVRLAPELREAAEKQPLLYNKQFYFTASMDEKFLTHDDLPKVLIDYYNAGRPVAEFLLKAI